ncbi:MAG: hypothetical protein HYW23_01085 [Candidatus Aenigmarchaeota archaeon]|nr:hypothetical protein [Candidatus Aenigmarchaeota archaeon]
MWEMHYSFYIGGKSEQVMEVEASGQHISSVTITWNDNGDRKFNCYEFYMETPKRFLYHKGTCEEWPSNRSRIYDRHIDALNELGMQVPDLADSLKACIELMRVPGSAYKNDK